MIHSVNLSINSFDVLQILHQELQLHSPLSSTWEGGWLQQSGQGRFLRRDPKELVLASVKWGRTQGDGETLMIDDRSPAGRRRGLLPAAGLQMIVPNATQPWLQKTFYVSKADGKTMVIGCSWDINPNTGVPEFAILTNSAGRDLAGNFPMEPVIVPRMKWKEWLAPSSAGSLFYPTSPGTFLMEQR